MNKSRIPRPGRFSGTMLSFAAGVVLAAALVSCGGKGNESEAPAPAANPSGKPVDSATAGTVTGMIKLDGTPPKPRKINMAAEPNCAKEHSTPAETEDVVPGEGGTLQNVVVYLKGDFSQYSFPPNTTPAGDRSEGLPVSPARACFADRRAFAGGQFRPDHA